MTNILATIVVMLVTNWCSVGTFTPTSGWPQYDVQEGRVYTNTLAVIQWHGERREFLLQSDQGTVVGTRHIEKPAVIQTPHNQWLIPSGTIYLTNHNCAIGNY